MLLDVFMENSVNLLKKSELGWDKKKNNILNKVKNKEIFYTPVYGKVIKSEKTDIDILDVKKFRQKIKEIKDKKNVSIEIIKSILENSLDYRDISYYITVMKGNEIIENEAKLLEKYWYKKVRNIIWWRWQQLILENTKEDEILTDNYFEDYFEDEDYDNEKDDNKIIKYKYNNILKDKIYVIFYLWYKDNLYRLEYHILDYFYDNIFTLHKNNKENINNILADDIEFYKKRLTKEKQIINKINNFNDVKEAFINIYKEYINIKIRESWEKRTLVELRKKIIWKANNILKEYNIDKKLTNKDIKTLIRIIDIKVEMFIKE